MTAFPQDLRFSLLRRHGTFPLAYSAATQPNLQYFGDHRGYIAYKMVGRTALVLSDPVAPANHCRTLISDFVAEHPDVCFCQISPQVAEILVELGFLANEMGVETRLDLEGYSLAGNKKQNLRNAANRISRLGYTIRECSMASLDRAEVKAVSDSWKQTRTLRNREVVFLNRPIVLDDEPDVRKFFVFDRDNKLIGFAFFDPIYESDQVVGYITSIKRHRPDADLKVAQAIYRFAIETFQREGRKWLFLGISPMAGVRDTRFRSRNWLVKKAFLRVYENGFFNRFIYPLQGHALHKRQYGGVEEQTYFAFNRKPGIPRLFKLLRACNVI
jgi:phosphatidylglycerol lysyltransferase